MDDSVRNFMAKHCIFSAPAGIKAIGVVKKGYGFVVRYSWLRSGHYVENLLCLSDVLNISGDCVDQLFFCCEYLRSGGVWVAQLSFISLSHEVSSKTREIGRMRTKKNIGWYVVLAVVQIF